MADKFYDRAVFTRKDLVELSGIPVDSLKQYLTRGLIPYSDHNPRGFDPRKARKFRIPETIRIVIMAKLSREFGIKPSAAIDLADCLSWGCVNAVQQEIWRNTGSDKRFWRATPTGKIESYPRRRGELPHTVSAFWTNGDFAGSVGVTACEWSDLYDNTMGHMQAPEFAFTVIPDERLWTEVIGPVLTAYEHKTETQIPIADDLRALVVT